MIKILFLLASALLLIMPSGVNAQEMTDDRKPLIIAHRCYWNTEAAGYAENSVAAFKCALNEGFWGSEFDTNITKDGAIVIYHDGKADKKPFNKHNFAEYSHIRLENGEPLPTLDDFLEVAVNYPGTKLIYELKPQSTKEFDKKLFEASKAKLQEYGLLDPSRVIFITFSKDVCRMVSEELPEFNIQYLGFSRPKSAYKAGADGISTNRLILKLFPGRIRSARKLGMSVNCWTVNKESDISEMADIGVDMITTDHPDLIRDMQNRR